jgi:hypothetical protein
VIGADVPITPSIVNARSHAGNAHYVSALEWRMFFVGEPVATSPEHALAS